MKKFILFLLTAVWFLQSNAVTLAQTDTSVTKCSQGVELFDEGDYAAAYPLLEAGFYAYNKTDFTHLNLLGRCALSLVIILEEQGEEIKAREVYQKAETIFADVLANPPDRFSRGLALQYIGALYEQQDRYSEATSVYTEALVIFRELGDLESEGTILARIAWMYNRQRQDEIALVYFEESLAIQRRLGNKEQEVSILNFLAAIYQTEGRHEESAIKWIEMAELHLELGNILEARFALYNVIDEYSAMGRYDDALVAYTEVLAINQELDDEVGVGATLALLGDIYRAQGQDGQASVAYNEALIVLEEARASYREVGNYGEEIVILEYIAEIYRERGQPQAVIETLEEILAINRETGNREHEGITLGNIATDYLSQGRYAEALVTYMQALTIHREAGNRSNEAYTLNGIAHIYMLQDQSELALPLFEEALTLCQDVENLICEAVILKSIGELYTAQTEYEKALTFYEEALGIYEWMNAPFYMAPIYNQIGLIRLEDGKKFIAQGQYEDAMTGYEEALTNFEEALTISQEFRLRREEGTTLSNIAYVYFHQEQYETAIDTFQRALAIHYETGNQVDEGVTLGRIAELYQMQGEYGKALEYYQQALDILEALRANVGNDEARATFISQYEPLYHRSLSLYIQENKFVEAFFVGEQGRARAFSDSLATGSVQLSDREATTLIAIEKETYQAVFTLQNSLDRARSLTPPAPDLIADLEVQLDQAQSRHVAAVSAVAAYKEQLRSLISDRYTVQDLSQIQSLLNPQSTLISFWMLPERTIAFILSSDSFDVVSLDVDKESLNTQIKGFHDFPETISLYPATAVALYDSLIRPLLPYLSTPHLIIVPHQALHYIPFASLTDGERYLMDDFAITYLPSASMLQFLPGRDHTPVYETALVIGNPVPGPIDAINSTLPNLPGAGQSAQIIADRFNTVPLLGNEATESILREQVPYANILHIGAHGRFNTAAPLQSALYLTPREDSTDVSDDGRLHVDEVFGLPFDNIELVVLSACETNLGYLDRVNPLRNISSGDELVSLNRAFLFHSPTVISTLWTVDDTATGLLMEQFYTYLSDGKSKADALRLAQMYVRDYGSGEYANPYYWAGFILSGDGGEIDPSLILPTLLPPLAVDAATTVQETAVAPTATPPSSDSKANGLCAGAALPLVLAVLALGRRKKSYQ